MTILRLLLIASALSAITVGLVVQQSACGVMSKTLDADNVIHNYEWFKRMNKSILSRVGDIAGHKAVATDPEATRQEKQLARMELRGMKTTCRTMVGKYNARAAMANRNLFKTDDTPLSFSLDVCK